MSTHAHDGGAVTLQLKGLCRSNLLIGSHCEEHDERECKGIHDHRLAVADAVRNQVGHSKLDNDSPLPEQEHLG